MTTPVSTDDLVQGAARFLGALTDVTAALGKFPDDTPWLFQHTLWATVEGSSSTAAVLTNTGGWAGANVQNTLRFPRLGLELWVDPQRDSDGNVTTPGEAQRRADALFAIFDKHLHRCANGVQMWGTVRTIACVRLAEPSVYAVPDGDGLLRAQTFYAVTQG
jgi:hypothetical protein